MSAEKLLEHQGAILLAQSDGCAVWQFRNETGDGTMTTYEVFPGVMLAFNDFHMERYECDFVADRRMLAIDHCREGRMEYAASDNLVAYTAAGDEVVRQFNFSLRQAERYARLIKIAEPQFDWLRRSTSFDLDRAFTASYISAY